MERPSLPKKNFSAARKSGEVLNSISLYIHVPFCVRKCRYCDFYSVPYDGSLADRFIEALGRERRRIFEKRDLGGANIHTIYCGGGTPSLLSPEQWRRFCELVVSPLNISPDLEWTVECNPDSFTGSKAGAWLESGVTRCSLGVQSLDDRTLRLLGRTHSSARVREVLSGPALESFASVGVDIIYGLPDQTIADLESTLDELLSMHKVSHLSAYQLTISRKTPFGRHESRLRLPCEGIVSGMMDLICERAERHGFEQYEISNFARAGHACRHNQAYWSHTPYLGLGPSAHSYLPPARHANTGALDAYLSLVEQGKSPAAFSEHIGRASIASEMILLGLRTAAGINETAFANAAGDPFSSGDRKAVLENLVAEGYLAYAPPFWRPTSRGLRMADALARKLA
ncbi:MAG: radical SAM family heme chaperone HemW [Chitinivibrionales bacterium]|nr:radical SAM family heme chaperone HemW [Chitinivibrionales bacterium]MBD3394912.1 radical SAM family heme chaperone HemW [Chitinivibrionales bacterium]